MSSYVLNLIEEGEHQHQDFKFCITDSRKIARSLVAFANTSGGRLLIGVKDNGNIAGVRTEEEYYMIESAAHLFSFPEILFTSRVWQVHGKTVLEITVEKSEKLPHFVILEDGNRQAYVRVNDQNLPANAVMMQVWKKQKRNNGIKIKYSDKERLLLKYLRSNKDITLSKLTRIARITKKDAEHLLSDFIVLGIVEICLTEQGARYTLNKETIQKLPDS